MLKSIVGILEEVGANSCVLLVGDWGLEIRCSQQVLGNMSGKLGKKIKLWSWLRIYEEEIVLYGFEKREDLVLFKMLISVSGVGPKGALSIMDLAESEKIGQAIDEAQADWISRAKGVGKKTAQRIIVELRGKLVVDEVKSEEDEEIVEIMKGLGFARKEYEKLFTKMPKKLKTVEEKTQWLLRNINS